MFEIFCHMFDRSFASAVVNSALGTNIFYVSFVKINSPASKLLSSTVTL